MTYFSDFDVVRVGSTVIVSAFADGNKTSGRKLQLTLNLDSVTEAEDYEGMFKRLFACAELYEEVPDDVLFATHLLTKGKRHDRNHT